MHLRKRVLVTGGSGFLGSHLCARLLEMGDEVLCVDNFFSSDRANVEEFLDNRHIDAGGATTYFAKQYRQDDPSGIFTVAESRPLPVTRHAGWAVRFDSVTGK